ncbi:hypothetical protein Tco_0667829 [Tanacetum coccineum]
MSGGPYQDQNSRVVSRGPLANTEEVHVQLFPRFYKKTAIILLSPSEGQVLGDEGATTATEGVQAEPHSYFQLRTLHLNLLEVEKGETMVDPQPTRKGV